MGFDLPTKHLAAAFNALDQELASRASRRVALSNVSQLFGQTGYPFEADYLDVAAAQFGAPVATVDFQRDTAGARKDVNEWVAASTRGAIPELVPPDAFTEQTRLAIVNAGHLKAPWATPFSSDLTRDRRFHRLDGSTIQVPMMEFWQGPFAATWAEDHVAVELPYAGEELAMLVVVPEDPIGFIDALDPDVLDDVTAALRTEFEVEGYEFYGLDLRMPRFSTRTGVDLKQRLIHLGIRDAFSPEAGRSERHRGPRVVRGGRTLHLGGHPRSLGLRRRGRYGGRGRDVVRSRYRRRSPRRSATGARRSTVPLVHPRPPDRGHPVRRLRLRPEPDRGIVSDVRSVPFASSREALKA